MLKYLFQMMESRIVVAISLRRLRAELELSDRDGRLTELSRKLTEHVEQPLWVSVDPVWQQLPEHYIKQKEKKPDFDVRTKVASLSQRLLESCEQIRPVASSNPSGEAPKSRWGAFLADAVNGVRWPQEPPPWEVTPATLVCLMRNEALANLRWRVWRKSFDVIALDKGAEKDLDQLSRNLKTFQQTLSRRRGGAAADSRRAAHDGVELFYEVVRKLTDSYVLATDEYLRRLQHPGRHPIGPNVDALINEVEAAIREAPQYDLLVKLARAWDKAFKHDVDFLETCWETHRDDWGQAAEGNSPLEQLLIAVCDYFDADPNAVDSGPESPEVRALRAFADEIGRKQQRQYRLVFTERDEDPELNIVIEQVPKSDVEKSRRLSTGIIVFEGEKPKVLRAAKQSVAAPIRTLIVTLQRAHKELAQEDPLLSYACGDLADQLAGRLSIADWLDVDETPSAPAGPVDRSAREAKIWYLVHLANTSPCRTSPSLPDKPAKVSGDAILQSLGHCDVQLEDGDVPLEAGATRLWFVGRPNPSGGAAAGDAALQTKRGLWITLPGRASTRLPPPAIVMGPGDQTNEIGRRIQPFLAELKLRAPQAKLWQDLDKSFLCGALSRSAQTDREAVREIFQSVQDYASKAPRVEVAMARCVLREIVAFLDERNASILPLLDDDCLTPLSAERQPRSRVRLGWRHDSATPGTILEIVRYATDSEPGIAIASGGPNFPPYAEEYFAIPPGGADEFSRYLETRREELAENGRDPAQIASSVQANLYDAVRFLKEQTDSSLLNAWLRPLASKPPDTPPSQQSRWYELLRRPGELRTYPAFDPSNCEVKLTVESVQSSPPDVVWEFSDLPVGTSVDNASVRFANRPQEIAGRFSLGPEREGTLTFVCNSVKRIAEEQGIARRFPTLAKALQRVADLARDRYVAVQLGARQSRQRLQAAMVETLDLLAAADECEATVRDDVWRELRQIATHCGGKLLPEDWAFVNPEATRFPVELAFHGPNERARLQTTFGAEFGDRHQRPCRLIRYVGAEPKGWAELNAECRRLPESHRESIQQLLQDWPRSLQKRNLIQKITELHIHWFDICRPRVEQENRELALAISRCILDAVRGQRLDPYLTGVDDLIPANRTKYVEITYERRGGISGDTHEASILKILRPGIQDQNKEPLCKARIVMSETNA